MYKKSLSIFILLSLLSIFLSTLPTSSALASHCPSGKVHNPIAANPANDPCIDSGTSGSGIPIQTLGDVESTLNRIVGWLITIFWIIAVGAGIWAALMFVTAGGDAEKTAKAKKMIFYTVIAAIVAILSTGIRVIVTNLLKGV